jgi:hypothetical protein
MTGEDVLEPASDAIEGDPNTALAIVSIAPRKRCSTDAMRGIQDGKRGVQLPCRDRRTESVGGQYCSIGSLGN